MTNQTIEQLRKAVQLRLPEKRMAHVLRVEEQIRFLGELLLPEELPRLQIAALLHDIARPEECASKGRLCHAKLGAEQIVPLLEENGFPAGIIREVADAVRSHRYRGKDTPASLEADIIFDADKLDSLGAVGIGRAFLFAGHENARLHNTEEEALNSEAYSKEDTAYREYLVKLRYLPRRMRSDAGRKLAVAKAAFMADFFEQLNREINFGENTR